MQIQLKQTEIVAALKQFIAAQGIDLSGKKVDVTFTAGRKETGLSAEIFIDEYDIPDFGADDEDEQEQSPAVKAAVLPFVTVVPKDDVAAEPAVEPVVGDVKTTSLFT